MKITLIGAGNLAWHLGPALAAAGHEIISTFSRTEAAALALAARCGSQPVTSPDFWHDAAEVFIVCVADAALETLTPHLRLPPQAVVMHTSGTFSLEQFRALLPDHEVPCGVWYPLQTFSKAIPVRWEGLPILTEAGHPDLLAKARQIAESLQAIAIPLCSDERRQVHLSAVIAGNFANHLWGIASLLLQQINQPLRLLEPLLQETLRKAVLAKDPFRVQTGPAIRGDQATLERHLQLLNHQPQYQKIYQLLTESIQQTVSQPNDS